MNLSLFYAIKREFNVNDNGESFCSRRAIARMSGKHLRTIRDLLRNIAEGKLPHKMFEPFNGVVFYVRRDIPFDLAFAIIKYYAFKGNQTAQETLDLLSSNVKIEENGKPRKIYNSYEKMKNGSFVYLIKNLTTGNLKIGYSKNPCQRLVNLQQSTDCELKLLAFFEGTVEDEQTILAKYTNYHIRGEWFKPVNEIYLEFGLINEIIQAQVS